MLKVQEKKRSGYQRKLDPRAVSMIMVGYDKDFTYRLYNPDTGKVIISRDVHFDEVGSCENNRETPQGYEFILLEV